MSHELGVPPSGSGHSPKGGAASYTASPAKPSVPNADALVNLMSAWGSLPSAKFHAAYPFFAADRKRIIEEFDLVDDQRADLEATALLFAEYADAIYLASAIEARRAVNAEGGAVACDESAVAESETPKGHGA